MEPEDSRVDGLRSSASPDWDRDTTASHTPPARPTKRRPPRVWVVAVGCVVLVVGLAVWAIGRSGPDGAVPVGTPSPARTSAAPAPADVGPGPWATDGTRPLVGTLWVTEHLDGPLTGEHLERRPWVRFGVDGTFVGHDGCNAISGHYATDGGNGITLELLSQTLVWCPPHPGQGFGDALQDVTGFRLSPSGLSLREDSGLERLTFHAITLSDEPAPPTPLLRVANNTNLAITRLDVLAAGVTIGYGPVGVGASSEYQVPSGAVYRYAGLDVLFADGTGRRLQPTDYVGEIPLAPGRYTYVVSLRDDPQDAEGRSVIIGVEEAGRPAPSR